MTIRITSVTLSLCVLSLIALHGISSCSAIKKSNHEGLAPLIHMKKSPCNAVSCPVYTIAIYDDGLAAYTGEHFVDRMGLHTKMLRPQQFRALREAFVEADLWQYEDSYPNESPDASPTVTITYRVNNRTKKISGGEGRPDAIIALQERLSLLAESGGWLPSGKEAFAEPE